MEITRELRPFFMKCFYRVWP